MNLNIILKNKEEYYRLAIEYYDNIDEEYREECLVSPKSISVLMDHDFIVTPCIEIRLELLSQDEQKTIGNYFLYTDEEKQFVDEFLIYKD
ncbi:hypothetical protein CLU81_2104 [Flavobacterium sp. 9]|uniref:hypothetical protein n=1 Tax=Flavobacterium sp. 9 TaxID=2035198 RepID=UPI000C176D3D|nr:hypothetical protein [Flavobacterium sp. 9]PIF31602.1 hypothetical protein CLU81_2104 [Flavobacterium sp. 9]